MYIIAEIGFNHEGDLTLAEQMIRAAASAGVHAVKFQTYRAKDLALPSSPHYEAIKCGEMDLGQHQRLAAVAQDCQVDFLSTPYSPWAVDLLEQVGISAYKVASMDCTNTHLLKYIAQTAKPVYLSTGMANVSEIGETLEFLRQEQSGPVTLLHCISMYPASAEVLNLEIIPFLRTLFEIPVGYSDHYPGTKACLAAAMLGATVIETHFTLDASKKGADHVHSVEPEALKTLIADIALFTTMRGEARAIFRRPDRQYAEIFRRGVYAARKLSQGAVVKEEDILLCRPVSQLSPQEVSRILGKPLVKDVAPYETLTLALVCEEAR